jgi:tetraacyldisaccharide 4'-kinase
LIPLYRAGFLAHQAWLSRELSALGPPPALPLAVIGALRAGGSGKTSLASALAREMSRRGIRVALLAYRIGPGPRPGAAGAGPDGDCVEVGPASDWRETSEEAVLLSRESGARVFATRDRARAWRRLASGGAGESFDLLIADDGYQDPRLKGAFRVLLSRPGESPRALDLLPAGPFREDASGAARADLIVTGPWEDSPVTTRLPPEAQSDPTGQRFRRRLILPAGWERGRPCLAHCALGDPAPFLAGLAGEGVRAEEIILGRNHAEPPLARLRAAAARHPGSPILCTRKDGVKLEGAGLPLALVEQRIEFDAGIADRIAGLVPGKTYLVDYPRC